MCALVTGVQTCARPLSLNVLIVAYVDVFRALPPLVVIVIVYFGLPSVGITLSGFTVLWLVLSLVLAAFSEEIFWSGILAIRRGQWEAARSTGLGFGQTLAWVILPQAVRMTVTPLPNSTDERRVGKKWVRT